MRLPLIDHQAKAAASKVDSGQKPSDDSTCSRSHMTLEDYEKAAFDQLNNRKPKAKAKPAKSLETPSKHTAKTGSALKLGCPRCRGSIGGCSTCRNVNSNGIRLHGKVEWETHMKMSKRSRLTK